MRIPIPGPLRNLQQWGFTVPTVQNQQVQVAQVDLPPPYERTWSVHLGAPPPLPAGVGAPFANCLGLRAVLVYGTGAARLTRVIDWPRTGQRIRVRGSFVQVSVLSQSASAPGTNNVPTSVAAQIMDTESEPNDAGAFGTVSNCQWSSLTTVALAAAIGSVTAPTDVQPGAVSVRYRVLAPVGLVVPGGQVQILGQPQDPTILQPDFIISTLATIGATAYQAQGPLDEYQYVQLLRTAVGAAVDNFRPEFLIAL